MCSCPVSTMPGTREVPGKYKLIKRRSFLDCELQAILSAVLILVMLHENEPRDYAALSSSAFLILDYDLGTVNMLCFECQQWCQSQLHVLPGIVGQEERDRMEVDMRMQGEACTWPSPLVRVVVSPQLA